MNLNIIAKIIERKGTILMDWAVSELPILILITLVYILVLRLIRRLQVSITGFFLDRLEKQASDNFQERQKRVNTLAGIIALGLRVALVFVYILIFMDRLGIAIGPLLASAGIVGLAVGFGAQELVRDVISGFFLLLEDQVRVADVVSINGTAGVVESVELRTVKLRDVSGTLHIFQNGKINTLANLTKDWSAMVFDIGVAYKENVDQVMKVISEVGEDLRLNSEHGIHILEPIEVSGLNEFAASSLLIRARIKTVPGKQWEIGREFRKRLKIAFDREKIEIPFPQLTLHTVNPMIENKELREDK
jgi:small conductance mechanosensitive channel